MVNDESDVENKFKNLAVRYFSKILFDYFYISLRHSFTGDNFI